MPTVFGLGNLLSNTYNVPIWANVKLDVYYRQPTHKTTKLLAASEPCVNCTVAMAAATPALGSSAQDDVPNEVVPLQLPFLVGNGDRCGFVGTSAAKTTLGIEFCYQ